MKILTLLIAVLCNIYGLMAQNIGLGTSTPHSSALLDVSSTSQGMLIPRMTSVQRGSIELPATGLIVFDTDTKTIWTFDGISWKNLYANGGFALPFSQTVNTGISAFQITNQGMGAAIEGASTHEYGTGSFAKATGEYGRALSAFTDKAGGNSIYATADNGKVFHGENYSTSNTNVLMSLLNRGLAKTATFQLVNTSSTDANVQIAGNNLGEQLLIYQTNTANSKAAISVINSGPGVGISSVAGNGPGVSGTSTANHGVSGTTYSPTGHAGVYGFNGGTVGSGVIGVSDAVNTQAVYGTSLNGIGVRAIGNNYRAVQAISSNGTALFGSSTNGYSLDISGNVKIAGGNTNPSAGSVLTSIDGNGNAVWKKAAAVGFKVAGSSTSVANTQFTAVNWTTELYDLSNNFDVATDRFLVPVTGLYSFSAAFKMIVNSSVYNLKFARIQIMLNRNGAVSTIADIAGPIDIQPTNCTSHCTANADARLTAGDLVYVTVYQQAENSLSASASCGSCGEMQYFSGHLVVAN